MSADRSSRQTDWLHPSLPAWGPNSWPVAPDWRALVDAFFSSAQGRRLGEQVQARIAAGVTVYPPDPLRALKLTPRQAVRVVILGQDPYHGPGQANGLAFSVAAGVKPPPSLRNIQTEIAQERLAGRLAPPGELITDTDSPDLTRWARQGVLLLNTSLSVEDGRPASHAHWGWEVLTGAIVDAVHAMPGPVAFLLWGRHAQARQPAWEIAPPGAPRLILRANHPSPLSARRGPIPFLGCGHFALANDFLRLHGAPPINW